MIVLKPRFAALAFALMATTANALAVPRYVELSDSGGVSHPGPEIHSPCPHPPASADAGARSDLGDGFGLGDDVVPSRPYPPPRRVRRAHSSDEALLPPDFSVGKKTKSEHTIGDHQRGDRKGDEEKPKGKGGGGGGKHEGVKHKATKNDDKYKIASRSPAHDRNHDHDHDHDHNHDHDHDHDHDRRHVYDRDHDHKNRPWHSRNRRAPRSPSPSGGGLLEDRERKNKHDHNGHDDHHKRTGMTTGILGTIDIVSPVFRSSVGKPIASLVLKDIPASNDVKDDSSPPALVLTASSQKSSGVWLNEIPNAPPIEDGSELTVSFSLPVLRPESSLYDIWCTTFDPNPPAGEPFTVQPCNDTITAQSSQRFAYNPESGFIRPLWPVPPAAPVSNSTAPASNSTTPTSNSTAPASNSTTPASNSTTLSTSGMKPASEKKLHPTVQLQVATTNSTDSRVPAPPEDCILVFTPAAKSSPMRVEDDDGGGGGDDGSSSATIDVPQYGSGDGDTSGDAGTRRPDAGSGVPDVNSYVPSIDPTPVPPLPPPPMPTKTSAEPVQTLAPLDPVNRGDTLGESLPVGNEGRVDRELATAPQMTPVPNPVAPYHLRWLSRFG